MWNGNEMTMKHKTCHSLLKNYKISVEFATAIVKNFLPRGVGGSRVVTGAPGRGGLVLVVKAVPRRTTEKLYFYN